MLRLSIAAACALLLSACAGNDASAPPQTAELRCPDRIDPDVAEEVMEDVQSQWPEGLGRPMSPMERDRLFPDC